MTVLDGSVEGFDPSIERKQIEMLDFEIHTNDCNINHLPSRDIVQEIIEFYSSLKKEDRVIVHCFAGISRSTAVALIIAYLLIGNVEQAASFIGNNRSIASPNRWLCYEADKYFGHHLPYLFMAANNTKYFPKLFSELSNHKRYQ